MGHLDFNLPSGEPVNFKTLANFMKYGLLAKETIKMSVGGDGQQPPDELPFRISLLLSIILKEDLGIIGECWKMLRTNIWDDRDGVSPSDEEIRLYNKYGLPLGISYRQFYPPTRVCQALYCKHFGKVLKEPLTHKATLFTLRKGALPVYTTSLYCRGCKKRYYHNYTVHKHSSLREYYGGVPEYVQVTQHFFMEAALLEFFVVCMVFGWLSALNLARIYNECLAYAHAHILGNKLAYLSTYHLYDGPQLEWQTSLELRDEYVMNGFFLYSLLLDTAERGIILQLPHDELSQKDRLQPALDHRNKLMEGIGQEQYLHACDLCFQVSHNEGGELVKIQATVCDGKTIGRPCCTVHDCPNPLINNRHRFCQDHFERHNLCAVVDCQCVCEEGFRTCHDSVHRALEKSYFERGKSLSQLRKLSIKALSTLDGENGEREISDIDDDEDTTECSGKSDAGNLKKKTYFGRRRTHNEQLIMRPCGVILSRATFYGSESVSAVNAFARATFPTPQSSPELWIFDNNCQLDKYLRSNPHEAEHFKDTGRPVDVFHFKSKHKTTDTHCQRYCNPASFPELIKDDKWAINMSVCEQTNGWLGGYQAIVRDMECTRYSFYLDEMIKRKNRYVVKQSEKNGHNPWTIPYDCVFPDVSQPENK